MREPLKDRVRLEHIVTAANLDKICELSKFLWEKESLDQESEGQVIDLFPQRINDLTL